MACLLHQASHGDMWNTSSGGSLAFHLGDPGVVAAVALFICLFYIDAIKGGYGWLSVKNAQALRSLPLQIVF